MLLALGTPLPCYLRPWKTLEVDAIMVSAYYILENGALRDRVLRKGLKEVLDFDGVVVLDSGAFQALRHGRSPDIDELMSLYEIVEDADIKLSLDWPDEKIFDNYQKMQKVGASPVVSADNLGHMKHFEDVDSDWIFIGRLANMLMHYGRHGLETLDAKLSELSSITGKKIWVLGVGNWKTIPILSKNNVNGTDTSSYRVAAAFGDIIVPGMGTCHVSGRKIGKKNWGMHLAKKDDVEEYLDMLEINFHDLVDSFESRVLFNAFVLTKIKDNVC